MNNHHTIGIGAALVDFLVTEKKTFIEKFVDELYGMTLVDRHKINEILEKTSAEVSVVPGGSACNTIVGLANLGSSTEMFGVCSQDEYGDLFCKGLESVGVKNSIVCGSFEEGTGQVLSLISEDAQRTMLTSLGASGLLVPEYIPDFDQASQIHLEGYLLFNQAIVESISKKIQTQKVSLDLASFEVVEINKEFLTSFIPKHVNILLANEDEAKAFTGKSEEESLEIFASMCDIVIVKLGVEGALMARGEERVRIKGSKVNAIDTTGAGDLWASGFFYGLQNFDSLEKAGQLANAVATEVVQVIGASISKDRWVILKDLAKKLSC